MNTTVDNFVVEYNDVVVKIVEQVSGNYRSHPSMGFTGKEDSPSYTFHSNYSKCHLEALMGIIGRVGFPANTVGICEEASGFNNDIGHHFPVPECFGLYFLRGEIDDITMERFRAEINVLYKNLF